MKTLKRYNAKLHTWYESWSEEDFSEVQVVEHPRGEYVKACEAIKLLHRIERMQKRIDKLEGRS